MPKTDGQPPLYQHLVEAARMVLGPDSEVVMIVVDGPHGQGVAVGLSPESLRQLPSMLRQIADQLAAQTQIDATDGEACRAHEGWPVLSPFGGLWMHWRQHLKSRDRAEAPPKHYRQLRHGSHTSVVISNHFGKRLIRWTVAEQLQREEVIGDYTAIEFAGLVWWKRDEKRWACAIWQHGMHTTTLYAETLEALHTVCCRRFGDQ